MQFRDVFEVDGEPVRDRQERLARLFLSGDLSTAKQVEEIASQSARYNIGSNRANHERAGASFGGPRSFQPAEVSLHGGRSAGATASGRSIGGEAVPATPSFKVTAEGWIVKFEEVKGPTLVSTSWRRRHLLQRALLD